MSTYLCTCNYHAHSCFYVYMCRWAMLAMEHWRWRCVHARLIWQSSFLGNLERLCPTRFWRTRLRPLQRSPSDWPSPACWCVCACMCVYVCMYVCAWLWMYAYIRACVEWVRERERERESNLLGGSAHPVVLKRLGWFFDFMACLVYVPRTYTANKCIYFSSKLHFWWFTFALYISTLFSCCLCVHPIIQA